MGRYTKAIQRFSLLCVIALSSCSLSKNVATTSSASYEKLAITQQSPSGRAQASPAITYSANKTLLITDSIPSTSVTRTPKRTLLSRIAATSPITRAGIDKIRSVSIRKGRITLKNAESADPRKGIALKALLVLLAGVALSVLGLAIYFANYKYPTSGPASTFLAYLSVSIRGITFPFLYATFGEVMYFVGFLLFLRGGAKLLKVILLNKHGDFKNFRFINTLLELLLGIALIIFGLGLAAKNNLAYGLVIYGLYMMGIFLFALGLYALFLGITTMVGRLKEKKREKALPDY